MKKKILSMVLLGCLLVNTTAVTISASKNKTKKTHNNRPITLTSSRIDPESG